MAGGPAVPVGQETVTAPPRAYAAPAVDRQLTANLGPITSWGLSGLPARLAHGADLKLTLSQSNLPMTHSFFVLRV